MILEIRLRPLPSISFSIHNLPVILLFNTAYWDIFKALLNKPRNFRWAAIDQSGDCYEMHNQKLGCRSDVEWLHFCLQSRTWSSFPRVKWPDREANQAGLPVLYSRVCSVVQTEPPTLYVHSFLCYIVRTSIVVSAVPCVVLAKPPVLCVQSLLGCIGRAPSVVSAELPVLYRQTPVLYRQSLSVVSAVPCVVSAVPCVVSAVPCVVLAKPPVLYWQSPQCYVCRASWVVSAELPVLYRQSPVLYRQSLSVVLAKTPVLCVQSLLCCIGRASVFYRQGPRFIWAVSCVVSVGLLVLNRLSESLLKLVRAVQVSVLTVAVQLRNTHTHSPILESKVSGFPVTMCLYCDWKPICIGKVESVRVLMSLAEVFYMK
jgi:hypothetical protein